MRVLLHPHLIEMAWGQIDAQVQSDRDGSSKSEALFSQRGETRERG